MHRGYRSGIRRRVGFLPVRRGRPAPVAARTGIDLFIEEGAYTTLASAVSLLVVLTLVFSAATATWSMSRAGDVQVSADATALAGANVVSSYYTAATVVDASILSLSLTGLCVTGAGLVGLLVPGVNAAASEAVDAGIRILETRNDFATSASKGLEQLEISLPALVAANAARTCGAQGSEEVSYTGVALAVPMDSASDFPAMKGEQISTEELEQASAGLDEVAQELAAASERTAEEKERAWLADCGREGMNMQERAARLSGLPAAENPDYASSITWEPDVGLDRARSYYAWRRSHVAAEGTSVEELADAAARQAFYDYAYESLADACVEERDGKVVSTVPLLPKNASEVRTTKLYSEAIWPATKEPDGVTLHYAATCPGAAGASEGLRALSAIDAGTVRECKVCRFSVGDVGKVPAASTSIDNGFEYHLREFTEALNDYVDARNREIELEEAAREQADAAGDSFEEALSALAGERPRIAPPGRNGCVSLVVSGAIGSPDELSSSFGSDVDLAERGAISAAVLAPDEATRENNVLSSFLGRIEERAGGTTVISLVGNVMDLWGELLVSYGDLSDRLDELMDDLVGDLDLLGSGTVARWLGERVRGAVGALGIEPVDLSCRKPVLTDSSNAIAASGMSGLADAQDMLRSIPLGTTDPRALLQAVGYQVDAYIQSAEFVVAEIPLPGGGTIPLTIRLRDVTEAL